MAIVNLYHNVKGAPDILEVYDKPSDGGGEGDIYFSKDGRYVVKIYKPNIVKPEKRPLLEKITELGTYLTPEEEQFLCWPVAVVRTFEGIPKIGCVTRRIPRPPYIKLMDMNVSRKAAVKQFQSGMLWSNYLQVARGIAQTVTVLHGKGCVHADLSYRNFFVNPDNCDVVLFDLDGLVVPSFLSGAVDGTPGMIAPEILLGQSRPNELSERHSLAVQILQTLLFRNVFQSRITYDPDDKRDDFIGWGPELTFSEDQKDRRNRPSTLGMPLARNGELSYRMLTPALQRLTERACIDGKSNPAKRPMAKEWIDALSSAVDELYRCSRCRHFFPYPHWLRPHQRRSCPFCGQRITADMPSVIYLYEPRSRGRFSFVQRYLVMGSGWKLFSDVLNPQRNPPMTRKGEASIGHVERNGKDQVNFLVNDEDTIWQARLSNGGPILTAKKGDSLPLKPGTIIHFGDSKRLMVVSE